MTSKSNPIAYHILADDAVTAAGPAGRHRKPAPDRQGLRVSGAFSVTFGGVYSGRGPDTQFRIHPDAISLRQRLAVWR